MIASQLTGQPCVSEYWLLINSGHRSLREAFHSVSAAAVCTRPAKTFACALTWLQRQTLPQKARPDVPKRQEQWSPGALWVLGSAFLLHRASHRGFKTGLELALLCRAHCGVLCLQGVERLYQLILKYLNKLNTYVEY